MDVLKNGPYTHRVRNVGKTTFEVLDVLFPGSPSHPSPASFDGPLVGETPEARVYRWVLAPGASCPMHTHKRPSLWVAAAEFPLRTEWPGKKPDSGAINPGDYKWTDSEVIHRFVNEGKQQAQIIEIEMK